jgi:hypothetical protein
VISAVNLRKQTELTFLSSKDKNAVGGNTTVGAEVQIVCTLCYIKGVAQANFTVPGAGNFSQTLLGFTDLIKDDVKNVTKLAFAVVGGAIENDARAFLNTTNAIKDKVENITQAGINAFLADIDKVPGLGLIKGVKDDIKNVTNLAFGKVKAFFEKDMLELKNVTSGLKGQVKNVTKNVFNDIEKFLDDKLPGDAIINAILNTAEKAFEGIETALENAFSDVENLFHTGDLALPTVDVNFNMHLARPASAVSLQFQLTGLELYLQLDTILSAGATYTLPLYHSETPLGVSLGKDFTAGVIVAVDLILDVQAQIDIRSGFHLKLPDTFSVDIEMFSQNVSKINL